MMLFHASFLHIVVQGTMRLINDETSKQQPSDHSAWATGVPRAPPPPLDRKHLICIKQDGRRKNYEFTFFVISPLIDGIFM